MVSWLYFRRCYIFLSKKVYTAKQVFPLGLRQFKLQRNQTNHGNSHVARANLKYITLHKLKSCFHRLIRSQNKSIIRGRLFLFIDPKREMTSGGVVEDEKNRSVATDYQHQQQPPHHPPPFQGVSNYPPPQQQPPPPGYPQPAQPYVSGNFLFHVFNGQHVEMIRSAVGFFFFLDIFYRISF